MADRILLRGGKIYLGSGRLLQAGYIVIEDGWIAGIGEGNPPADSQAQVVDLTERLILPGVADSHLHLVAYALSRKRLDLSQVTSLEEALTLVGRHAADLPPGKWLLGRGWDKQRLGLDRFPDKSMLDQVAPRNPVALDSHDGHLIWVNSVALAKLGLSDSLPRIEGGRIETDAQGRPTGIFMEKAVGLVRRLIDREQASLVIEAISDACQHLLKLGITSLHTIEGHEHARYLDQALDLGKVPQRLFRLEEVSSVSDLGSLRSSSECIKLYADGALGSQTAYMFEAYEGQPQNLGIRATDKREIEAIALAAAAKGLAVAVHAIGDRANSEVLDAYTAVRSRFPDAILRIEHAQVLRQSDIKRFASLGIIASMQPIHVIADMGLASRLWGSRCRFAYAWRSLLEGDVPIAFGSDAPIEDPDPLKGIYAAVTRRKPGSPQWYPEQCISLAQAIDCYTLGGALASGRDRQIGSIAVGKAADFTVLQDDILGCNDPGKVLETRVWMTIIGGQIAYAAS